MPKPEHWSDAGEVDVVPLEPGRLVMFRSTVRAKGEYSQSYAYFLIRPDGNYLFHGPDSERFYHERRSFFDSHGGIALQVCSHADDISAATPLLEDLWGTGVYANRWDVRSIQVPLKQHFEGFVERNGPSPDLTALYTPGHTLGFHCFVWTGERARYLFASHTLVPLFSGWTFACHPLCGDAALRSLEALRTVDVDLMLPNALKGKGDPAHGPHAPLPFGKDVREAAVKQARAGLLRKLRPHKEKAEA
jgi:glyoxylase-like metal-dependent hydrolase (beta-lactamase superfamily II)